MVLAIYKVVKRAVADLLSRTILAPVEIPVGAVTAAIGAPVFIYLLRKT